MVLMIMISHKQQQTENVSLPRIRKNVLPTFIFNILIQFAHRTYKPAFFNLLLQQNLPHRFALLMETYAVIQVSILLSVINQMSRSIASMLNFYV